VRARLSPLGDHALVVTFGDEVDPATNLEVRNFEHRVFEMTPEGWIESVPAFTTVTLLYDPLRTSYERLASALEPLLDEPPMESEASEHRTIDIPVHYGGEFGPDLGFVAAHNGLDEKDVVDIHSATEYLVYMIGFAPGFPYLGGMSPRIAAPRRDAPRSSIPAGSVCIAGRQTGVYPFESPGGWQLIGRTPLRMFRPEDERPSLLEAGDRVRFKPIERTEFDSMVAG
jgi:inhibitor of KinA